MAIDITAILIDIDTEIATYWQDILDMQANYFAVNGKYAQGITTHGTLPVDGVGSPPDNLTDSPTDQIETWNDLVTLPSTLKTALTVDVYETITDLGWIISFEVTLNGVLWSKILDLGPLGRSQPWYAIDISAQESLEEGILACWPMNETSGTRYDLLDSYHLTDYNTVGYIAGILGNAAVFNPINEEYFEVKLNLLPLGHDFTFVGWFYIDSIVHGNGNQKILQLLDDISEIGKIEWYTDTNSPLKVKLFNKELSGILGPETALSDKWHFVEYSYDSANGILGASLNYGNRYEVSGVTYVEGPTSILNFGALKTGFNPIVRLNQWCLFDRLLTPTELSYLYNNGNGREIV